MSQTPVHRVRCGAISSPFESVPDRKPLGTNKGPMLAPSPLLPPECCLGAAEIAILATAQCAQLTVVYRRPRVASLSPGDELVTINHPLQPGQIVDSNRYALKEKWLGVWAIVVIGSGLAMSLSHSPW